MSDITLINQTKEEVRLAIFQNATKIPNLGTYAWQVVTPPPGGSSIVQIPDTYMLKVRYSSDPSKPSDLDTSAKPATFAETTASFSIDAITSQDGHATGAVINQHYEDLVLNEVRVVNNYSVGVEASVCRGDDSIYAPEVIWPGALFMEDMRGPLSIAVVSQFVYKGQRLVEEEISLTQTEVQPGDAVVVTGSMWTGYSLSKA